MLQKKKMFMNIDSGMWESSDAKVEFTMHAVSPSYVLHLCEKLF